MSEALSLPTEADYLALPCDENQFVHSFSRYATLLIVNTLQTKWVDREIKAGDFPIPAPKEKITSAYVAASDTEKIFNGLVKQWQDETAGYSVKTRRYAHSSYHSILLLRDEAVPLILRELQRRPDWWFEALKFLTNANPVVPGSTFDEAAKAWIDWGKRNKKIT